MPWPKTGPIRYHAQLGLLDKVRSITELVVCIRKKVSTEVVINRFMRYKSYSTFVSNEIYCLHIFDMSLSSPSICPPFCLNSVYLNPSVYFKQYMSFPITIWYNQDTPAALYQYQQGVYLF